MTPKLIHKFKLWAQLGTDEPVLLYTLPAAVDPRRVCERLATEFGSKWRVWMDEIPATRPNSQYELQAWVCDDDGQEEAESP
jgi:hypothetical protein